MGASRGVAVGIRAVGVVFCAAFFAAASFVALPDHAASASSGPPAFLTRCDFSHRLADDPIVAPGKPGAAHSHDFFGNKETNGHSTAESIRAGHTTCTRPLDRSAYWVPTIFRQEAAVKPERIVAYYVAMTDDHHKVIPFPSGLRMIAGDAHAARPQAPIVMWMCNGANGKGAVPANGPKCATGSSLRLRISFPPCWDGRRLDSPDHQSHMAYPRGKVCPASHPVALPRLTLFVVYSITGGSDLRLASGGVHSGHADFFNGWDQKMQRQLVRGCLNAGRRCLDDETPSAPTTPTSYEQRATYMRCSYNRRSWC